MCGIAGAVNFNFDPGIVNGAMGHRGPDEQASFGHDNVLLHHLRLAIVAITEGHQPMHYLDRYTIIFNGEIYNHLEVRQQLKLDCKTKSDTETILQAWHKEGVAALHRFDGMFVFAIYDRQEKRIFITRDRAGKKPLYYFNDGKRIAFASELNALRALLPLEADDKKLVAYLRMGSFFRHHTPYKNVNELPSGSWMTIDTRTLAIEQKTWWQIGDVYRKPVLKIAAGDALLTLDDYLQKAVRRRLESSDLEVGTFLSGGIDSGLVTSIAARLHPKIKTFTVSFDGAYNEAPLAKLVAEKYQTQHQEITINFDHLLDDVEGIIAQYGEPFFDNSAIPSWYVSQAAARHLTVILNGDGADELFGGYRRHVPFARFNFFNAPGAVKAAATTLAQVLPAGHEKMSKYTYAYRLVSLAGKKGFSAYLASWTDIFEGFEDQIGFGRECYMKDVEQLFNEVTSEPISGLRQLMWLDFDVSLFDALLVKMDIATMAHSLEGRSPFLSKELLEWAPLLPDALKVKMGTTKYLLRRLANQYLPAQLVDQPKRGFEIPLKHWVNHELKELIEAYLTRSDRYFPALINAGFVTALLDRKIRVSDEKRAKMIWAIFCLEVWYHKCLKKELEV